MAGCVIHSDTDVILAPHRRRDTLTLRDEAGGALIKIVDISMPLSPDTCPPLDYPHVEIESLRSHDDDGFESDKVCQAIHTGTHIDAPYHFYRDGITIERVQLDKLIGPARVADLRGKVAGGGFISIANLGASGVDAQAGLSGMRLLLYTGWAEAHWNQEDLYTAAPHLEEAAAEYMRDLGIMALGVDFPVDPVPSKFLVHLIMLGAGIPLIENIVHMGDLVGRDFTLVAAPVKLVGGDGAPARVVALLDD